MRNILKLMAVAAVALGIVAVPSALAAPPSNDTFAGATSAAIGFSETLDTSQATTDSDDAQLNQNCGAPATDASVWYAIQGTDQEVIVDVSQSNYSAGVLVGVGTQGNLQLVTCGPGAVAFFGVSGTTYYVLAIDDQLNGDGLNGGQLHISFGTAPPPPTVDISVNPTGTFNSRTGVATVSGSYTCANGDFIDVFVDASQNAGRFTVLGFGEFFESNTCDGAPHSWSADVFPQSGKFAGGKALTVSTAFACGIFECSQGYAEQKVVLRGKK